MASSIICFDRTINRFTLSRNDCVIHENSILKNYCFHILIQEQPHMKVTAEKNEKVANMIFASLSFILE